MTMKGSKDAKWTVVAECNSVADASIIEGALKNADIPATIINSALQSALPMTFTWAPGQIVVPDAFVEQAREIVPDEYRV